MKKLYTITACIASGISALSTQAAVILPDAGNSVTFEAEAYDAGSGIVIATSGDASGGSFVDDMYTPPLAVAPLAVTSFTIVNRPIPVAQYRQVAALLSR